MAPTYQTGMNNSFISQKKIMKNTALLYVRMAVIMLVSLYTTRVVLNVLGETDYGIYNIVGSVVISLAFIQNALMSASQRFISYEIGLEEKGDVRSVFSMSINVHVLFLLVSIFFLETVGIWFINNILDIPENRLNAANVVFQLSVATYALNLLRIPYNSLIVAYEKMNVYALLSIIEALLKLFTVFAIIKMNTDKLVFYSIFILVSTLIVNLLFVLYCRKKYRKVSRYIYEKNPQLLKRMLGFSGWNLVGGVTSVAVNEGPSYFLNVFLGVGINAATGIAKQVSSALYQFAGNFQVAFNPQIVKSYASNDEEYLYALIKRSSIISYYLLLIVFMPFYFCKEEIFGLWLVEIPEYSIQFSTLLIASQLVSALSSPLWMLAHATGDIKVYQIVLSFFNLLIIPVSWVILHFNFNPCHIFSFLIVNNVFIFFYRVIFLQIKIKFPSIDYLKVLFFRCILPTLVLFPITLLINIAIDGILGSIFSGVVCVLSILVFLFLFVLEKEEKEAVLLWVKTKL